MQCLGLPNNASRLSVGTYRLKLRTIRMVRQILSDRIVNDLAIHVD